MNDQRSSPAAIIPDAGPGSIPHIRALTAIILVESGGATVVGVRKGDDATGDRIEGALQVTIADLEERPGTVLNRIHLAHTIILYATDHDERTSVQASRALIRAGCPHERLAFLTGEPHAWERVGFSVLRGTHTGWQRR